VIMIFCVLLSSFFLLRRFPRGALSPRRGAALGRRLEKSVMLRAHERGHAARELSQRSRGGGRAPVAAKEEVVATA